MAQGLKKAGNRKKSAAATKKQQKKVNKKLSKGRLTFKTKGRKAAVANQKIETSKAINKKNEALASSRAVSAGHTFFLKEIKQTGEKEIAKNHRNQARNEKKNDLSSRLKSQLRKMGQDS